MTRLTTARHRGSIRTRGACDGQATTITTDSATEIFVRCAPIASGTGENGRRVQSRALYDGLANILNRAGAGMRDVVIEKAFFRDITADFNDFHKARREAYRKRGVTGRQLPAITCLMQPPCRRDLDIELQAYAVVPNPSGRVQMRSLPAPQEHVGVKLLQIGEARYLYVGNVAGHYANGGPPGTFREQSDRMFDTAAEILDCHGASFLDVLRTWIYVDDIDRNYDQLNASRNAFFDRQGVRRLPASTGIGSGLHPSGNQCTLDLYALLNPDVARIEVMQTPTLNEAADYGSAFSRGMSMTLPEQTYLFISGTASVDEEGATVHLGDVRAQIERMLLNIEHLLRPHDATWTNLVQAVTFLKSPNYLELFRTICAEQGLTGAPNTIVQADVCRPELLCEMEAIAVLPTPGR